MTLEDQLTAAFIAGYRQAGLETGYWGTRFLQAVRRNGGLPTAKRMLAPRAKSQRKGLDALLKAEKPHLTVEYIILQEPFRSLFSKDELAVAAQRLEGKKRLASEMRERIYPDEIEPGETYVEGALRRVAVNAYERDSRAREACLRHFGPACAICEMTFSALYGTADRGPIHVHHLKPLARTGKRRRVDPTEDLIPVCPNCHAMLHYREEPYAPEELRQMIGKQAG